MMKSLAQSFLDVSLTLPLEDIKVKQAFDRAYDILQSYGYSITPKESIDGVMVYDVIKTSTGLLEDTPIHYIVSKDTCTCPQYAKARGNLCKHRIAIMIYEDMQHD